MRPVVRLAASVVRRSRVSASLACAVAISGGSLDGQGLASCGLWPPGVPLPACLSDPGAKAQVIGQTRATDDLNTAHRDSSNEATPEERGVEATMFGPADDVHARHLRHTPARAPSRADSIRAWALVREMRLALAALTTSTSTWRRGSPRTTGRRPPA